MEGRQKYRLVPGEGVCYNGGNRKKNGGGAAVKKKTAKTNVMRQLDRAKIAYEIREYPHEEGVAVDGVTVAGPWARSRAACSKPW